MSTALRLALAATLVFTVSACGGGNDTPTSPTVNVPFSTVDLRVGTGTEATNGRRVSVNYTLWLYASSGTDNKGSLIESGPYAYTLGGGGVIQGWERGIPGMRVGGLRRLIIPPDLAYGSQASSRIPANSTLVFEVELLAVQ
jgi:FKBP-type peptidyl-prolyl cis-trans isomerase FkpA